MNLKLAGVELSVNLLLEDEVTPTDETGISFGRDEGPCARD